MLSTFFLLLDLTLINGLQFYWKKFRQAKVSEDLKNQMELKKKI